MDGSSKHANSLQSISRKSETSLIWRQSRTWTSASEQSQLNHVSDEMKNKSLLDAHRRQQTIDNENKYPSISLKRQQPANHSKRFIYPWIPTLERGGKQGDAWENRKRRRGAFINISSCCCLSIAFGIVGLILLSALVAAIILLGLYRIRKNIFEEVYFFKWKSNHQEAQRLVKPPRQLRAHQQVQQLQRRLLQVQLHLLLPQQQLLQLQLRAQQVQQRLLRPQQQVLQLQLRAQQVRQRPQQRAQRQQLQLRQVQQVALRQQRVAPQPQRRLLQVQQ
ncbi:unnamed protein product [Rotaria socialis]|uniref:Uncharacterized protein n=2 Tax=Rotaria socialis TaxID=392032 RepID=A0A820RDJ6_9BILA|nr:unnamed protein product [Rotaria socialis]